MDQPNMNSNNSTCNNKCPCPHHKVKPLAVTLIGVVALLGACGVVSANFVNITWPILLIIIGLMMLMKNKCKCC